MSHDIQNKNPAEINDQAHTPEISFVPDTDIDILKKFWRDTEANTIEYEAIAPPTIGYMPQEERELFLRGQRERAKGWLPEMIEFPYGFGTKPGSFANFFPATWELIKADLEKMGMKPTKYLTSYFNGRQSDGEVQVEDGRNFHTDGDENSVRFDSDGRLKVKKLALYVVASENPTEFYTGKSQIEKIKSPTVDWSRTGQIKVKPMEDYRSTEQDPSHTLIIPGERFAIMRMSNLTIHRSPRYKLPEGTTEPTDNIPSRSFMRLWCEEWVDADDELLTLGQLYEQLPAMNMTQHLGLVAVDGAGNEKRASIGYSSDLKSFAIMQYDDKGNIASWLPLPTRKTNYTKGAGSSTHISQEWPNGEVPEYSTRFKITKR